MFLSIKGQKALRFHQKYLHLCSKDYWSYWFGTTWRWVINDRIFIFGCTMPLIPLIKTIIEDSKNIFTFKKKKERKRKKERKLVACSSYSPFSKQITFLIWRISRWTSDNFRMCLFIFDTVFKHLYFVHLDICFGLHSTHNKPSYLPCIIYYVTNKETLNLDI